MDEGDDLRFVRVQLRAHRSTYPRSTERPNRKRSIGIPGRTPEVQALTERLLRAEAVSMDNRTTRRQQIFITYRRRHFYNKQQEHPIG